MKKIISLVLLLSLCLGLFAGCDLTQFIPGMQPNAPASNLENAKSLVFNTYKPANKDEIPAKSSDFEVMTSVLVDGETFPVAWTVEITAGAADAVKIVDGSSAAFKKVDLTEKPEEEVQFTLTATISDAEGNTETVSFKYKTLKFEAPSADKVVISFPKDNKYVTGTEYKYTSSSGSVKMELVLSENKAEGIAFTMIEDDATGYVTFKTDDGYYLSCDATSVEFVTKESDNTKFVLEATDGGYFIKCAIANYSGKAQYLEVYSGYLTCYGMGSDASIYVFALEAADGANGKVVKENGSETPDDGGDEPEITFGPAADAVVPVAGTAYKLGLVHGTNAKTYYISGGMSGFYMATNEAAASGLDAYIEAVDGGYNLYVMENGAKKYINLATSVDSKDPNKIHINAVYGDTATTVYTYDETLKTLKATNDGTEYILGTRNDKTYNTVGFCKVDDKPFYCQFFAVTEGEEPGTGENPGENENPGTDVPATGKVELNATNMGLGAYAAGNVTVGGVNFGYTELGSYGDGIQLRQKDGRISALYNAVAFASPIVKIEIVWSATKNVFDNNDAFVFTFGEATDALNSTVKLSTVAGTKTYTVTPDAANYTCFKLDWNITYSGYVESITIHLAGAASDGTEPENPGTEPENPGTEPENPGTEPENPGTETPDNNGGTVSVTVADKGWTNATLYAELVMDSNITVTTSGTPVGDWGLNTGKYYTKDLTWRIYQNESPSIVVKAAEGKTIVSVKITYLIDKTGILTLNGSNITSGTVVDVNANSVTFSVGNTGTATNGQVKITAIEVIYA